MSRRTFESTVCGFPSAREQTAAIATAKEVSEPCPLAGATASALSSGIADTETDQPQRTEDTAGFQLSQTISESGLDI